MIKPVADSTIIAAYAWPESAARVAWKLGTNSNRVSRVWNQAKRDGILPPGRRPAKGFDLRQSSLMQMMRVG